jgi:hypothetical protein
LSYFFVISTVLIEIEEVVLGSRERRAVVQVLEIDGVRQNLNNLDHATWSVSCFPDRTFSQIIHHFSFAWIKTFGAGSRARTDDIQVGNLTLYQLSYARTLFMILKLNVTVLTRYCTQSVKSGTPYISSASVQYSQSHIDDDSYYPHGLHVLIDHYYLWLTIHYSEAFVQKPLVNIFVLALL